MFSIYQSYKILNNHKIPHSLSQAIEHLLYKQGQLWVDVKLVLFAVRKWQTASPLGWNTELYHSLISPYAAGLIFLIIVAVFASLWASYLRMNNLWNDSWLRLWVSQKWISKLVLCRCCRLLRPCLKLTK